MSELVGPFPPDVKPVHVGVYKTHFGAMPGYSYWDGAKWSVECATTDIPESYRTWRGTQKKTWWGLAEKPADA